jgi:hypothetical protein
MPRQPNGEGNGGGPPPPRYNPYLGPNYQGFVFVLVSSSNAPTHILTISTQTNENIDAMANITGLWYPAYNPSNTINPISGYIAGNGESQIIACWWGNPNDYHALQGTLTYNVGKLGGPGLVWPSAYLDGDVTVYANENPEKGGPGHVSGTGRRQPLAAP